MTKNTSSGKLRNYECVECGKCYSAKNYVDKSKRYCSTRCKDSKRVGERKLTRQERKIKNRVDDFPKSAFFLWMAYEIRSVGTLEILKAIKAAEDFHALYAAYCFSFRCYGSNAESNVRSFNFSHVSHRICNRGTPNETLGLLHASNLFTGEAELNRSQYNKPIHLHTGFSIRRRSCKPKWNVDKSISNEELSGMMRDYLGAKVFDKFLGDLDKKLNLTERYRLAREIFNAQEKGKGNPLPRKFTKSSLEAEPVEKLRKLKEHQTGKEVQAFSHSSYASNPLTVYAHELERFSGYDSLNSDHRANCEAILHCVRMVDFADIQLLDWNGWWTPLDYYDPYSTELGDLDLSDPDTFSVWRGDVDNLLGHIKDSAFNALQGNHVGVELLHARIRKRFKLAYLVPSLDEHTNYSYSPATFWSNGSDVELVVRVEKDWSTLKALGFITDADIISARATLCHDIAQAHMKDVERWRRDNGQGVELPEWTQRPDLVELLDHQSAA